MLGGLLVGLLIVGLTGGLGLMFYVMEKNEWNKNSIITTVVCIVLIIISGFIGNSFDNNQYKKDLVAFKSTSDIYYSSLTDETMTGFERVEIVKMANEANRKVSENRVELHAWWNFCIDNSIKAEYDKLELIGVEK